MAYPEKLLTDDEQVIKHLHPSWITIAPGFLWFVVLCAGAGVGIAYAPDHGTGRTVVLIIIAVVWLVLVSWLFLRPLIAWRTSHYVFTTHRVLIRRGLLKHVGRDIALQRISDVGFEQTLWDRMVHAGTLTIESASEHGQETLAERAEVGRPAAAAEPADREGRRAPPAQHLRQPARSRVTSNRSKVGISQPQQGSPPQQGGYQPTQQQPPYPPQGGQPQ